ncbi:MAG TPA: hypothetical protein VNU97_02885 [Rhizomicrobium sp.]|jgi:hypothetical protein|nr:hypothetical protein [Rhizomicrobium sp.]
MKTHVTLAALALGGALCATAAFADGTAAPTNTMAPNTMGAMHPMSGGMMATHKPKPHKHTTPATGGMMAPTGAMAPSNSMGGSH